MAFKAIPNRSYHLVCKQNNMALGFTSNALGAELCQMKFNPLNVNQQFRFHHGPDFY